MLHFLQAGNNLPFVVSLLLMLLIALLEGVGLLLGGEISSFLDSLVAASDLDMDVNLDAPDGIQPSGCTRLLGWLRIGQVPALMLLIVFLTTFGLLGLLLQSTVQTYGGFLLPPLVAIVPVLLLSLPIVRIFGGWLARIMPQDESAAIGEEEFIGRTALITLGRARSSQPASARLTDQYGTVHYLMVEPDTEGVVFEAGQTVILTRRVGAHFEAMANTYRILENDTTS